MSEKLAVFEEALEKVKKELTQKRTDLATLARKTVEDFEATIPELRNKVLGLQNEIARLDGIIKEKAAQAHLQHGDLQKKYDELCVSLKISYEKRHAELAAIDKVQKDRNDKYFSSLVDLQERERLLDAEKAALIASEKLSKESLKADRDAFEKEKNRILVNINADGKKVRELIEVENNKIKILEDGNERVARNLEDLAAKEKIHLINEATTALSTIKERELKVSNREEKINELNVRLIADTNKNNARSAALDARESKLNERENNVKIAEAALSER